MVPIMTVKNDVSQSVNGYNTSGKWGLNTALLCCNTREDNTEEAGW